jgi:hypothetical protein
LNPVPSQASFTAPTSAGGWGGASLPGIDSGIRPPSNSLVNFTISKELGAGIVVEASYVGRFARGLMGVVDLATMPNIVDTQSGQDYYTAMKTMFESYELNSVGNIGVPLNTAAQAVAATASIKPIPWIEDVYGPAFQQWCQTSSTCFSGAQFANATQAFYALTNKGTQPGPNAPNNLTNVFAYYEAANNLHIMTQAQAQYFGLYSNVGRSNYNSGQFTVRKRFSNDLQFNANFTWSKSMDITSQSEAAGNRPGANSSQGQIMDPYHPELNYALSDFNRAGQFNGNFIYGLPVGTGKWIGGTMGHTLDNILGGWQVQSIFVTSTGRPWSYTASSRYTMHFFGRDLPIQTAPIKYKLHGDKDSSGHPVWYMIDDQAQSANCNLACSDANRNVYGANNFRSPYPGSAMNRNTATGPGFWNVDAAIQKRLRLRENMNATLRADAFNVMNHPNFNIPSNVDVDTASAGKLSQITSTVGNNRILQLSFRVAF